MESLVGQTGFVGSNLARQHVFQRAYHSTDIAEAYGSKPEVCVYAGVRAEKFLAASDPAQDMAIVHQAINNISQINPRRLVLISTIDVYPNPVEVDENTAIDNTGAHPYGAHRYILEQWVRENVRDYCIVRLPALFGDHLKKNFIYDLIHPVPSLLKAEKYEQLASSSALIRDHYVPQGNGFYRCAVRPEQYAALLEAFQHLGFTALSFTDSRASYQFYNLDYLWRHISLAMRHGFPTVNLAPEPLSVAAVYEAIRKQAFHNEFADKIARYDFRTVYAEAFQGANGYIFDKQTVLNDLCAFVRGCENGGRP